MARKAKPKLRDFDLHVLAEGSISTKAGEFSTPLWRAEEFPEFTLYYFTGPNAHQQARGFYACALEMRVADDDVELACDTLDATVIPFVIISFRSAQGVVKTLKQIHT